MKRHIRIRLGTKSFLVYSIVMIAIMLSYGLVSLGYITGQARKNYLKNADYECGNIADDFERMYDEINGLTTFLLSEPDVLSAIQYVSRDAGTTSTMLENRYTKDIRTALSSYYTTKYYYRVSYLNSKGIFATSNQWDTERLGKEQILEILDNNFMQEMGNTLQYWGTYPDPWGKENPEQVAGFIKKISGNDKGFFEIQMKSEEFQNIFYRDFQSNTSLMVLLDGEIIYSDEGWTDAGIAWEELEQMENGSSKLVSGVSPGGTMVACHQYEQDAGSLQIYCAVSQMELISGVVKIYVSIILLMLILTFATFLFLKLYTKKLVKPINYLKSQMDKTGIQNLEELEAIEDNRNELDEITALNQGYNRLISRIREGVIREKKLENLQLQANLDTLQAQINPHFINNTLSVISYRGMLLGDDEICEVCNSLSLMMKFSANTKKRIVTVREELDYVEAYLQLLKYRYQDKFEYRIQVAKELYQQKLPKVVIQQLVENSITHGYRTPHKQMRIEVNGWVRDGWWYIQVCDDGDGFEKEILENLLAKMEETRNQILNEHRIQDMEIGGMGIMNIYSRMLILHSHHFRFTIRNLEQGSEIVLSSVLEETEDD